MEMKRMFVQVVNLTEGKVFSLPTLYTDRTEACVCGQNYIRDRQAENRTEMLFFRVLNADPDGSISPSYDLWDDDDDDDEDEDDEVCPHPEQECCEDCPFYSECWEFDDEDNDEEPEHGESVFGGALVTELIDLLKSKAPEAPEEPNYLFEHWND